MKLPRNNFLTPWKLRFGVTRLFSIPSSATSLKADLASTGNFCEPWDSPRKTGTAHALPKKTISDLVHCVFQQWKRRARAAVAGSRTQQAYPVRCLGHTVRLSEPTLRQPATRVERLVVSTLKQEGVMVFDLLAKRVAHDLYRDALCSGGWVVDLGLFSSDLFFSEAAFELEAGNGLLWQIDTPTHVS